MFDKIKKWYDYGLWDECRVRNAVERGWVSAAEYEGITGKKY